MADPTYPLLVQARELGASIVLPLFIFRFSLHSQTYTVCSERERPASAALVVTSLHLLGLLFDPKTSVAIIFVLDL
jgi:hypothetical protein